MSCGRRGAVSRKHPRLDLGVSCGVLLWVVGVVGLVCSVFNVCAADLLPLRVSSNHRYLEDSAGTPLFVVGDSPKNLIAKVAIADYESFLQECQSRGFNWIWVCVDGQSSDLPTLVSPSDAQGHPMMRDPWEISTVEELYLKSVDILLEVAQKHRIYCALTPLTERQWPADRIERQSTEAWTEYGKKLATRFQKVPNLVWILGNDRMNVRVQNAIARGIRTAGDTHLMSALWQEEETGYGSAWVRKHRERETWIDWNLWMCRRPVALGGSPGFWQKQEYERSDPIPALLGESEYQKPYANASNRDCRMRNYAVALGGGCGGQIYGAGWLADPWDYGLYRENGGRMQAAAFRAVFEKRAWSTLVPDFSHTFVTRGYGTLSSNSMDFVSAAVNQGTLGMAYCPTSTRLTVDLSKFSTAVVARWYDPSVGAYRTIPGSPFSNQTAQDFQTPGENRDGDLDWVLVLEGRRESKSKRP